MSVVLPRLTLSQRPEDCAAGTRAHANPALYRRCQRSIVAWAGPAQSSAAKSRAEFPQLPKGPSDLDSDWFLDLYKSDKVVPWDTGNEQPVVVKAFEQGLFTAPVLDLGCGQGTNTIFLGGKGLDIVGVDLSPDATAEAERRLAAAGTPATEHVSFKAGSVLDLADILGDRKFDSALDSALYHCLDDATNEKYLAALRKQMNVGGRLVLIAMSDRNPEEGWIGPRRVSEAAVRHSLREEAGWRLESVELDARYEVPPATAEAAPQFAKAECNALVAVATRL